MFLANVAVARKVFSVLLKGRFHIMYCI